ncbi:MAG: N-formylglutamate amidohydrolase, partial [Bacteroidota bacterium]
MPVPGSFDPQGTFRRRVVMPPASPVVLSVPHAGLSTTGFEGALASTLDVRGDADLFVDELYGVHADAGGPRGTRGTTSGVVYVAAKLSRFVCDMNRDPDDVSPAAVPAHPAPRNADGRGFVWAITTTGMPALSRPLTLAEWQARQTVHAAYHRAISEGLARARDRFGFALLVDGHSMPSVGRAGHKDPGRPRADVVPGNRDGTSCSEALSSAVEKHFKSNGYAVSFNDPYKGGFITANHGRPADGIHAIQIELRRDLYMNEATFTPRPDGFARLRETLSSLLRGLGSWRP